MLFDGTNKAIKQAFAFLARANLLERLLQFEVWFYFCKTLKIFTNELDVLTSHTAHLHWHIKIHIKCNKLTLCACVCYSIEIRLEYMWSVRKLKRNQRWIENVWWFHWYVHGGINFNPTIGWLKTWKCNHISFTHWNNKWASIWCACIIKGTNDFSIE